MSLKGITVCGGRIAMPICDDFCSEEIEEGDRYKVVKHPLHLFDRFEHQYDKKEGRLTCNYDSDEYSDILEFEERYSKFQSSIKFLGGIFYGT